MENVTKNTVGYDSVIEIEESMYYSFNVTSGEKTVEGDAIIVVDDSPDTNNISIDHEKTQNTAIKRSLELTSPASALPKNILQEFKMFASTPTKKNQNIKTLQKKRESLGVAPLTKTPLKKRESLDLKPLNHVMVNEAILCENKENIPISIESPCNDSFTTKFKELKIEEKSAKKIVKKLTIISEDEIKDKNDSTLKENSIEGENAKDNTKITKSESEEKIKNKVANSTNIKTNISSRLSVKLKPILVNLPDLIKNRPSRILNNKRFSVVNTQTKKVKSPLVVPSNLEYKEFKKTKPDQNEIKAVKFSKEIEKPIEVQKNNIEKRRTIHATYTFAAKKRQSILKQSSNDNNKKLLIKPSRVSILRTSHNSPAAIKRNRKTIDPSQIKSNTRKSILPITRKIFTNSPRKSAIKSNLNIVGTSKPTSPLLLSRKSTAPRKSTVADVIKKSETTKHLVCPICSQEFRTLSLFDMHKKSHNTKSSLAVENRCKYCDRVFAIKLALDKHLLASCLKIPIPEKKKLLAVQDVDRKKAASRMSMKPPLPVVMTSSKTIEKSSSITSCSMSSNESVSSVIELKPENTGDNHPMAPPSQTKVKRSKIPHSGVYRTPTKLLLCGLCKKNFANILEYTDHSILVHSFEENNFE